MTNLTTVFGARRSLQRRLVANVVLALMACLLLATIILIREFFDHLDENAEAALTREAVEVATTLDPNAANFGIAPTELRFIGDAGAYRYTVFDTDWTPLVGGEFGAHVPVELTARLERALETGDMLQIEPDRIGVVVRRAVPGREVFVLATSQSNSASCTELASLRHEFNEQIGWVVFGVISVLAAAILAARRSLRPLRLAMAQAARVEPGAPELRLTADRLPDEFHPLIEAVNSAFDRLEKGYQAQRARILQRRPRNPYAARGAPVRGRGAGGSGRARRAFRGSGPA